MRQRIIILVFCLFIPFLQVPAKTVRINPQEDLSLQFRWTNTTYVVPQNLDLKGQEISIPYGSILKVKKNVLISNGSIRGDHTRIKSPKTAFLKDVTLSGSFTNTKSYLSWWVLGEDITKETSSLIAVFNGKIILNKSGRLSATVSVLNKNNLVVDGCDNEFVITNMPGTGFWAKENSRIEFKNMRIAFDGPYLLKSTSFVERCFRIQHGKNSTAIVHDISFAGFKNDRDKPCSFCGIDIVECNEGTQTLVYNVVFSNIAVVGDGIEGQGPGSNYGIKVSCQSDKSGKVEIYDCKLGDMRNYDSRGELIYEDTSGIYLAGISTGADGKQKCCNWDVIVKDCTFKNISKRNVKVQGDHVRIENLYSDCSGEFLPHYQNMYIGANGSYLHIKGLRGRYDGTIVKITGDYLEATDIQCSSELMKSEYARVFTLDGCTHERIENCSFSNESYIFIYPTENGFSEVTEPTYTFSNCNINVKHLIYSTSVQEKIFNEGVLVVENSNVILSGSPCFNKQGMKGFDFRRTTVSTAQEDLTSKRRDGTKPVIKTTGSSIVIRK